MAEGEGDGPSRRLRVADGGLDPLVRVPGAGYGRSLSGGILGVADVGGIESVAGMSAEADTPDPRLVFINIKKYHHENSRSPPHGGTPLPLLKRRKKTPPPLPEPVRVDIPRDPTARRPRLHDDRPASAPPPKHPEPDEKLDPQSLPQRERHHPARDDRRQVNDPTLPDVTPDTSENEEREHPDTPPPPGYASHDEPSQKQPRVIAVMNQKGGVGKTTTTVSLGAALAEAGLSVLLIDLDPQAHLSLSLGLDEEELGDAATVYEVLADPDTAALEAVQDVPRERWTSLEDRSNSGRRRGGRLGVLPAETNLAGIESELSQQVATGRAQVALREKTRDLIAHFDYVLIDCPPSLGLLTVNALTTAREVIVPMQAHFLALQGLSKLFETVQVVRGGINPDLIVSGVVLCMNDSQTLLAGEVRGDLQTFLDDAEGSGLPWDGAALLGPPIRRNIKLAEGPSFGQSILAYAPDSNGADDYRRLARSLHKHQPAGAGAGAGGR